jgi:transposase
LAERLVPDELWAIVEPLIPTFAPRAQGGGTAPVDARAVFPAIVFVLTSGCAWRHLPTSYRTRTAGSGSGRAGLWRRLHVAVLDRLGAQGELDWSRAILDAAGVREKGGQLTGPNPVDRGKPGIGETITV